MVIICGVVMFLLGCQRSSDDMPLGRLTQKTGQVERELASLDGQWNAAHPGAEFRVGDAIRTLTRSSAQVALDDGSTLVMEEDTLVRFLEKEPGNKEPSIDLTMGSAVLEAKSSGTTVSTSFGSARILGGGRVRIERGEGELLFRVLVGTAHFESPTGAALELGTGEAIVAQLGSAVFERVKEEDSALPSAQEAALPAPHSGAITARIVGTQVRGRSPSAQAWSTWPAGSVTVEPGSAIEVGSGSSATLLQGGAKAELTRGGSYVVGEHGQLVRALRGKFIISSETRWRLAVPGGFIETMAGSAQVNSLGAAGTEVLVKSGQARLLGKTTADLGAGERGILASDGTVSVEGRGLDRFDLEIRVGQSLVIHDPTPPTKVGFRFDESCEQGTLTLLGKSKSIVPGYSFARGKGRVNLPIGSGRTEYQLSCGDQSVAKKAAVARGTLTVLADGGSRPVPSTAPSTAIETNGRSYTVLYQNLLPQVTVRWPGAPSAAGSFVLKRMSRGSTKQYTAPSAQYTFPSGTLGEGTHTLFFEGGGRVSRLTTVNIAFDNAAPTVSLQTPVAAGGAPGAELHLVGTALPGWAVAVDGRTVNPDAEGRFSVTTHLPKNGQPALLYLTHPQRGAHVYLRRPATTR